MEAPDSPTSYVAESLAGATSGHPGASRVGGLRSSLPSCSACPLARAAVVGPRPTAQNMVRSHESSFYQADVRWCDILRSVPFVDPA